MKFSSKAIVLSVEKFGEADCYVRFLTQKWGVVSTLAKSARKSKRRYIGGLDLFCHDEIFLRGDPKDRPYLLELNVINSFPKLRENLDKILIGGKITQWLRKLADVPTPMPQLYSLLGQSLSLIEQESDKERLELLALVFKLKLLSFLGLNPQIEKCTRCEGPLDSDSLFDFGLGGVICNRCPHNKTHSSIFLHNHQRVLLKQAEQLKLTTWNDFESQPQSTLFLNQVLTEFASYHTQMRLPI